MVMCLICCETSQSALKFEWLLSWCALVWHSGQFHWWEWELQWSKASNDFSCLNWTVCDLFILVLFFVLFWFCFGVLFSEKLALFIFIYFAVDTNIPKFVFNRIKKKNFKGCPVEALWRLFLHLSGSSFFTLCALPFCSESSEKSLKVLLLQ